MRNVSDNFVQKTKTQFSCLTTSFQSRAVYEIMWKNMVEPDRTQMKIWRMRIACCIPMATGTHSEYVILTAYEIMWKNVERSRPQMTIWCMSIACRIHNATDTHSEYIILTAFPLQQWLLERASMLRDTYSDCLVYRD